MAAYKITGLGTPTDPSDACTKAYADSLTTGGSSSGTSITSADGTKKVLASNTAIEFQEGGVTHLKVVGGSEETTFGNYEIKTSSLAVSNRFGFRSTGVANQAQFYAQNFNDGGDRKTRLGSAGTGSSDVYVDLSLTN